MAYENGDSMPARVIVAHHGRILAAGAARAKRLSGAPGRGTQQVLPGITVATTVVHAASVALGFGLGAMLRTEWIGLIARSLHVVV